MQERPEGPPREPSSEEWTDPVLGVGYLALREFAEKQARAGKGFTEEEVGRYFGVDPDDPTAHDEPSEPDELDGEEERGGEPHGTLRSRIARALQELVDKEFLEKTGEGYRVRSSA